MLRTTVLFVSAAALYAVQLPFQQSGFGDSEPGWSVWAPRSEIAPRGFVDHRYSRGEAGALALAGNSNAAEFGGWEHRLPVEPGKWYRLTAWYRAEGLTFERGQVLTRLDWVDAAGKRTGQPDYGYRIARDGEWRRVTLEAPAPEGATATRIELYLANAPQATVWWDDIRFEAIPAPAPRTVTIAAVNLRPEGTGGPRESVRQFMDAADRLVPKADLILFSEAITVVGTDKEGVEVAEPVPGPTTVTLGELARRKNAWVAAGVYERDGAAIYNTAVLLDRQGRLAGKYRKVYLPREEYEGGFTPGIDYPVFETDFGKVGMMICYDVFFADPARALALRGAELILMPIWGGNVTLAKARAIENHVFLAAAGYDYPTHILDPDGAIVAEAKDRGTAAIATIDLNRRYTEQWLGDMRARFFKELRLDVPVEGR